MSFDTFFYLFDGIWAHGWPQDDPRSTPMSLKLYLTFPQIKLQLFIPKCSKLGLFFMTKCIFSLFLFWVIFTHHHPHIKNQFLKKFAYRWFTPTLFCTPWVIPKHVLRVPTMGILYFLLGGIQWCVIHNIKKRFFGISPKY